MKKLICLLLSIMLFLCGCDVAEEIEPETLDNAPVSEYKPNNDTFGVAYASNESCDPYTSPNKLNTELMGLICEPLFSVSETFGVTPVLCSEIKRSQNEYTIYLKDGVTFSDGTKLRATDVDYSIRAAMEASSFYATRLSAIQSIYTSNRRGYVRIRLKYQNANFPALLDFPIIKKGTRENVFPIGTGIYAPNEDKSALVARENHHSDKKPKYPTISLHDVASTDELVFEFDTHTVSILTSDPTGTTQITPSSKTARINVPTTQMHYIGFNARNKALADKNVRHAIARAIDRESAATSDFALMGHAAALPVHPSSAAYPKDLAASLSYDADTPLPTTEPLSILVNSENSGKVAVCNRIAEALTRLGAPTTVNALPFEEYTKALQSGKFTLYYAEVALGADFDISRLLTGSLNFGRVSDAELNAKYNAYLISNDARADFYKTFCDVVPFAPILFKDTAMYTQEKFFEKAYPTSQNVYHNFCDWVIGE